MFVLYTHIYLLHNTLTIHHSFLIHSFIPFYSNLLNTVRTHSGYIYAYAYTVQTTTELPWISNYINPSISIYLFIYLYLSLSLQYTLTYILLFVIIIPSHHSYTDHRS